ncbi:MAG: 2-phospho-L-lactate transferase [Actinomycetota bacterium]|nr:2-phospho-L-lactate transferase [Actinomycetota bacterium]
MLTPAGTGIPETTVRTAHGVFRCLAFRAEDGVEHLALVKGEVAGVEPVPVRVHSECLTGDVIGSRRCDCGEQLQLALARLGSSPIGVLIYVRGHEGRGIGLVNKLRAYQLQDAGLDTVEANVALGLPVDARRYEPAAAILRYLGVTAVHLLSNNPEKAAGLAAAGVEIASVERLETTPNPDNLAYLRTKQTRMGHRLTGLPIDLTDRGRHPTVVGIGGGIGASRLWAQLAGSDAVGSLTLVVNVADDVWMHGLRACPDIDTVLYALSGRQDPVRGWGLTGDSFECMEALRRLGEDVWFHLGDRDLATHLLRSRLLAEGVGLTEITARLAGALGVPARVLPATDDEVRTVVRIAGGAEIGYQEFLVQRRAADDVVDVRWAGLDASRVGPEVLDAIGTADLVVLGPSNPVASMLPILGIPGVSDAIRASEARVVAVTPTVASVPISDEGEARRARSRAALLGARGLAHRASSVARLYAELIDAFVVDEADAAESDEIAALGVDVVVARTLLHVDGAASRLVPSLLELARREPTVSGVGA